MYGGVEDHYLKLEHDYCKMGRESEVYNGMMMMEEDVKFGVDDCCWSSSGVNSSSTATAAGSTTGIMDDAIDIKYPLMPSSSCSSSSSSSCNEFAPTIFKGETTMMDSLKMNSSMDCWDEKFPATYDQQTQPEDEPTSSTTSLVIFNKVEAEFRCAECDRKFVHEKSYKSHMKSHEGAFRCEVCFRSFSNVANLNVHRRIHTGLTPYKCELCSMPFRTSGMYKRHLYKEHPQHPLAQQMRQNMVDYVCPNCGRILKTLGSYHRHVARHDVQNLHVCQLCHVDCFTHEAYLAHQKRCHSGEKGKHIEEKLQKNTCHICNTSFYSMMALWNHASLYHAPFAGLPCHICGKVATTRNAYMTHRRSHSGTKDLVCHVCKRRFNKASHLQDHIRVHLEDYTYKCPVCSKGFLRPKNLKTHLLAKHRPTVDTCCIRTLQRRRKKELMGDSYNANNNNKNKGNSPLHKRRILRLGDNGIQFLQNSGIQLDGLAENLFNKGGSNSDSNDSNHDGSIEPRQAGFNSTASPNSISSTSSSATTNIAAPADIHSATASQTNAHPIRTRSFSASSTGKCHTEFGEDMENEIYESWTGGNDSVREARRPQRRSHQHDDDDSGEDGADDDEDDEDYVPDYEEDNDEDDYDYGAENHHNVSAFPGFDWNKQRVSHSSGSTLPKSNPYVDMQGQPLFSKNKPAPITEKLVALAKDQARKRHRINNNSSSTTLA